MQRFHPLIRPLIYAVAGTALITFASVVDPSTASPSTAMLAGGCALIVLTGTQLWIVNARFSAMRWRSRRLRGPNRTDFTPLAYLGRSPLDPLAYLCVLIAVIVQTRAWGVTILPMVIICVLYGYIAWRYRSPRAGIQIVVSVGIPLALSGFIAMVAASTSSASSVSTVLYTAQFISSAAAIALGEALADLAERFSGRRPKILRAAWHGINTVGASSQELAVQFDVRPLSAPVGRVQAREAAKRIPGDELAGRMLIVKTAFWVLAPVTLMLLPVAFTDPDYVSGDDAVSQILGMVAMFSLLIVAVIVLGVVGLGGWRHVTSAADHLRLSWFAEANGFGYSPVPMQDGNRVLRRTLNIPGVWMLANATKIAEQHDGSVAPITQFSGVSEFTLPAPMPHLLLVRKSWRTPVFSAERTPLRSQLLTLEGELNRYFDVYCPKGHETDARRLLTPDIMAPLVDNVHDFDVEIIDDRLILRSRRALVTLDPGVWASIAEAVATIAGRSRQWQLWRDDHSEPDLITDTPKLIAEQLAGAAVPGRRLRGRPGLIWVLAGSYACVFCVLVLLSNIL